MSGGDAGGAEHMDHESDFRVGRHFRDGGVVVAAEGEIDLATVDVVRAELEQARRGSAVVVLDLRGVTFMDTSGLTLLLELQHASIDEGFDFAVVRGPEAVQRLLEVTGMSERLRIVAHPGLLFDAGTGGAA